MEFWMQTRRRVGWSAALRPELEPETNGLPLPILHQFFTNMGLHKLILLL
jgi:hypothetical protein